MFSLLKLNYTGNRTELEATNIQGVHNTIGDIRCHLPHLVKKRSVEEADNNAFITGYEISVSNNNRNFSVSNMMYILDSTCQDTINVSGKLRFVLKVYAYKTYNRGYDYTFVNISYVKLQPIDMLIFLTVKMFPCDLSMVNSHRNYLPAAFDFPSF